MQGSSDLIFLAIITAFILYKLYNLLGKTSDDPRWNGGVSEVSAMNASNRSMKDVQEVTADQIDVEEINFENKEVQEGLENIRKKDPLFSPKKFISGAEAAFEMIIKAYTERDVAVLETLLNPKVLKVFQNDIKARLKENKLLEKTLVAIVSSQIIEAKLLGNIAHISVKFITQQVNLIKNQDGEIVDGDPTQIDTAIDLWKFVRDVHSKDPVWKLDESKSET